MDTTPQVPHPLAAMDRRSLLEHGKDALVDFILVLLAEVSALRARVAELTRQLSQNSANSHWPPSADKPAARQARQKRRHDTSLRAPSTRSAGGQPGHRGTTLQAVANPDKVIVHPLPRCCPHCAHALEGLATTKVIKRQVFELPKPQPLEVTEHQAHQSLCPHCHKSVSGSFPSEVSAHVQYGPRLKSTAVYFMDVQLMPCERTAQTFAEVLGITLSQGTLINILNQAGSNARGPCAAILEAIQKSPVRHADETSANLLGLEKKHWVHVLATAVLTYLYVHPRRGLEAMRQVMEGCAGGHLIHDCWASYDSICHLLHGLCNAHLLRELIAMKELGASWAEPLLYLLLEMKSAVDQARRQHGPQAQVEASRREGYVERYRQLVGAALAATPALVKAPGKRGRTAQGKGRNLLLRLAGREEEVLAFLLKPGIPFDNNEAERCIRVVKLREKISGCFRALVTMMAFLRVRSIVGSARKQGYAAMEIIELLFTNPGILPEMLTG